MTAALATPARSPGLSSAGVDPIRLPIGWTSQPRLLRGLTDHGSLDHARHLQVHGLQRQLSLPELLSELEAVALRGRGGAGFALGTKIAALRSGTRPVVVINGAEGEPGSAKDLVLLGRSPHLVLDGAAGVTGAIDARRVIVAVSNPALVPLLETAIASRPDRSLFELRLVADKFIAGEARTLLRTLDGGPTLPPGRRMLPTERGLGGVPTLLSNAETFAQVAMLLRLGVTGFRAVGLADEPGTTLLTVSGAVAHPGVIEVPVGVRLGEVLDSVGAQPAEAVVIGGLHGSWLIPDPSVRLSRRGLAPAGVGAGVVMVLGRDTCGLGELARAARWLADQSAKQCGPCSFGLPAIADNLAELYAGSGDPTVLQRRAAQISGRGACGHPDGAMRFVSSAGPLLTAELTQHRLVGRRSPGPQPGRCVRPAAGDDVTATSAPDLQIDWTRCDGHGLCAALLPRSISVDEWGYPVLDADGLRGERPADLRRAVGVCPSLALRLE
jgi:NADH:ubiquinone oxidoreductase subunit F (NADH-binding)/ferredoxin